MVFPMAPTVVAHILIYNSSFNSARAALESLCMQEGFESGELTIIVSDNGSRNDTLAQLKIQFPTGIMWIRHEKNLGFSGGNNYIVKKFLDGNAPYLLILNPDVRLGVRSLRNMVDALSSDTAAGTVCPKLIRSDEKLNALPDGILDGAGMYMTESLRHLDYGAGCKDGPEWSSDRYVFGASGACTLMKREWVRDLLLKGEKNDSALFSIYPDLKPDYEDRAALYDEAFFAYREDADLAWRSQYQGWRCRYVGTAIGYHKRAVVPERRGSLPSIINLLGVRNRFLLQLSNYHATSLRIFVKGFLLRNVVVICGVFLKEQTSLRAFLDVGILLKRSLERRQLIRRRAKISPREVARWFRSGYTEEPIDKL